MSLRLLRSWRRVRVVLVRERADEPYSTPRRVHSPTDVAPLVRAFLRDDPREMFVAVYLDSQHGVIAIHACSIGTTDSTVADPRAVFGPALTLCASALVIAHNHPSGDPTPSEVDKHVTERMRAAGDLLGINVLDHLVIGDRLVYSFASGGKFPFRDNLPNPLKLPGVDADSSSHE